MIPVPHVSAPRWPEIRPGRLAERVRLDRSEGCAVALLGLPDDTGVRLNGGRSGAAGGPAAFRVALARYGSAVDGTSGRALDVGIFDAGDVVPVAGGDEAALAATHARVREAAAELHARGLAVVAIGGGHDLAYPTIAALSDRLGLALGGINLDAHLDVRERAGSGMPFRRLIEGGFVDAGRFVELGLGAFANDEDDLHWLRERGATLVFAEALWTEDFDPEHWLDRSLGPREGFVSIDLDGIDGAHAPGVSAVNPLGLAPAHVAALARAAGRRPGTRHFDLMELSPELDPTGRTARLAAHLFLSFLAGFAERPR